MGKIEDVTVVEYLPSILEAQDLTPSTDVGGQEKEKEERIKMEREAIVRKKY